MKEREMIDTSYIYSTMLEPYFKELVDQYVRKTPMNGATLPLS